MKKLALTIAVVLGMTLGASAQLYQENGQPNGGGLFQRGETSTNNGGNLDVPFLPANHGEQGDQNAEPIGSGAILLIGFGAAYAISKRKKN